MVISALKRAFDDAGIDIPFPQREVAGDAGATLRREATAGPGD
ncbi:hypothetical protein JCM30237_01710 [Halolamina litorea]|uniref:Mechanosensitive ion channel n=1 Tax=Halolamina litorea TaxID=1515593 RepID=A0ABD6BT17_9EURY|nr:hypothetical protein [Halolamina litorea]